jgi:AbrB family looped-hinge helix DNA binding protein
MQREAKVTSKGQVTIPREIRGILRIKEGDTVVFEADERGVRLRPQIPASIFAEYEGIWREGEGQTVDEINAQLRELRGADE